MQIAQWQQAERQLDMSHSAAHGEGVRQRAACILQHGGGVPRAPVGSWLGGGAASTS